MGKYGLSGKVLVLGLGVTGLAVARELAADGLEVVAWDDGAAARGEGAAQGWPAAEERVVEALRAGGAAAWRGMAAVVKSPGITMGHKLVQAAQAAGVPVLGDFDLLYRREQGGSTGAGDLLSFSGLPLRMDNQKSTCGAQPAKKAKSSSRPANHQESARFLGITGTNGKSTTTALVGHILRNADVPVAVGGNIGTAALSLPSLPPEGFYVLEGSSYQLEMLHDMAVDGAVLLNLTPDHLERHGDMAGYLAAKLRLFDLAKPGAVKVWGVDQEMLRPAPGTLTVSVAGNAADYSVNAEGELYHGDDMVADLSVFERLPGAHNWQNIACAYALLKGLDAVSDGAFWTGVQTFVGLPHRLERVREVGGVAFVNDSKATNGDSTLPALRSFKTIYWICGGRPKSDGLGAAVQALGAVRAAFTIGEAGQDFAALLRERGVPAFVSGTLDKAVADAYSAARQEGVPGAVVLLSPACASYDQYRNYEQRGEAFGRIVRGLKA
jgi:UDP-N-acetylmuramoylalanine--D-glutamate ligase